MVGTTTNQYGLGYSSDDYTCGANGLFWVFYNDGTNWGWKSSSNGQTWSSQSTFTSSVPPPQPGTNDLGFYCSGTSVYYAGGTQSLDTHFYYDTGTLNADGTITWVGPESAIATLGNHVGYTSITLDTSNNVWVALQSQNTGGGGPYYNEVWELTSAWGSSLTLTFASVLPIPQIVPLTSGKMALIYGTGHMAIGTETLTGATWTAGPSTSASNYFPQFSTAVTIGDTVEYCASDQSNVYYLTYAYGGASWSSPTTIASALACSATTDGVSVLGLFYVTSPTTMTYSQSNNGGSTFASQVTVSNAESSVGWVGAGLAVSLSPAKQAIAVWVSGSGSPYNVRFANISTAPVVNEAVTITDANPPAPTGTAFVSGCHATVASIPMDGLPHTFGADPSCPLTFTVQTDGTYSRYRFSADSPTWTFTTGTTSPDPHATSVYYQYSVTASYSYSGGTGAPPAPTLTSTQSGSTYSVPLTLTPTVYWLDGSAAWNVPAALTKNTQTWVTTSATTGLATGPMVLSFAYSPPVPPVTTTVTTTSTVTTVSTTTVTDTTTSVSTSTTSVTSVVTSTTTVAAITVTVSVPTTIIVTSTATTTATDTTTVSDTTTKTVTSTATTTSALLVPTSSSLTCDQSRPKVNQHVNCTDVVSTADQGIPAGVVTFSTSGGTGTFDKRNCEVQGNENQLQCQVQYTPTSAGVQTLTASYGGDPYHASSSDSATIFAGDTSSSKATSLSLTCDKTYFAVGETTNCEAIVLTADGGTPTGTVTWSATDTGTFTHMKCQGPDKNGQLECDASYSPTSMGSQTVTAAYAGDHAHLASTDMFVVFVQSASNGNATQQAIVVPVLAVLGVTASVFAIRFKQGRIAK